MKIASIIMPYADTGEDREAGIAHVREQALKWWGGYTESPVKGAWRDPATGVIHYDHAVKVDIGGVDDNEVALLEAVARAAGMRARQIAVAFILPNGEMTIANV